MKVKIEIQVKNKTMIRCIEIIKNTIQQLKEIGLQLTSLEEETLQEDLYELFERWFTR